MDLMRVTEFERRAGTTTFRPARWPGAVVGTVVLAGTAAMIWGLLEGRLPLFLWVSVPFLVLFLGLGFSGLRAACRPSSWMVCLQDGHLLVRFRSYLNHHFDDDVPLPVKAARPRVRRSIRRRLGIVLVRPPLSFPSTRETIRH